MELTFNFYCECSAVEDVIAKIKADPFARDAVVKMLDEGRFKELFIVRTENIDLLNVRVVFEPAPSLLQIAAAVSN